MTMHEERSQLLRSRLVGFRSTVRVLVIGDPMLDRYLWGEVNRISPEAPVPLVRLVRESENCGGAANVAINLRGLGLSAGCCGWIGEDGEGVRLLRLLTEAGVSTRGILSRGNYPTVTKIRVIGGHQQMLRLDREEISPPSPAVAESMRRAVLEEMGEKPAAVILSDYGKGALQPELCQEVIRLARREGIPVLVDPKGGDYQKYRHATAIFPNRQELAQLARATGEQLTGLLRGGARLREELGLDFVAVTLSDQGIALIDGQRITRVPSVAREVFDVSGAGDTVIATAAAALAVGVPVLEAMRLANLAAGIVVSKIGTVPITQVELMAALALDLSLTQPEKIGSLEEALARLAAWRQRGERVVFTNGCFDLLHAGHVHLLEQAKGLGDRLVVGLNSDESIQRLKGAHRPVVPEEDRARVIAALAAVDQVVVFEEDTPLRLIAQLRPEVLVKGGDYTEEQVVGGDLVKSWGGRVVLIPITEGHSTSRIVEQILKSR